MMIGYRTTTSTSDNPPLAAEIVYEVWPRVWGLSVVNRNHPGHLVIDDDPHATEGIRSVAKQFSGSHKGVATISLSSGISPKE